MAHYELQGSKLLKVGINNDSFRALNGAMVAYDGQVEFKRASTKSRGGIMGAVKRKVTGESLALMDCVGTGWVYIAFEANEINLVNLQNDQMFVEASNLVAVDPQLETNQVFNGLRGGASGQGLFTTTVSGSGMVAVLTDGPAIALEVTPGQTLCVDPQAYVAHRGQLQQDFVTDVNWRTAIGQGSGESFQLRFNGQGMVLIQPAERQEGIDV